MNNLFNQLHLLDELKKELDLTLALPAMRGWAASPDLLYLLARHAKTTKPQVVFECGSGVSTIVLARCMQQNGSGHVYTLDHDPQFAEETRRRLAEHGLSDWGSVVDAPLVEHSIGAEKYQWYDCQGLPESSVDMLVVDGPPEKLGSAARYPAGPILFPRLSEGASVFADDLITATMQRNLARWESEFPDLQVERRFVEKQCAILRKV